MSHKWTIVLILSLSLITHFIFFGHPRETVFDEVHFGKFISGYYTHEYFFDIHPPLGKLIIAGFGKLFDFKPEFSFASIGDKFPDSKYMALRFLPSLAGALLPLVIYLLSLRLGMSRLAATTAALLVVFENSILVQSRFILLDSFLLLFGFSTLWLYARYRDHGLLRDLFLMGTMGALAVSVKWTGATFLALAGLVELTDIIRQRNTKNLALKIVAFVVLPIFIYTGIFAIHFSLLTKTGGGDAFMSREFQKTLTGNENEKDSSLHTPNFIDKFIELNNQMFSANQRLTATHPYSSLWYSWPFLVRPIFYWVEGNARIYLLGNPLTWWLSTAAVVALAVYFATDKRYRTSIAAFLLAGFVINLLPFIGIKRVMFLYHYMTALIFALMILAYLVDQMKYKKQVAIGLLVLAVTSFIYFAPLTYGLKLSNNAYEQRVWLSSWK